MRPITLLAALLLTQAGCCTVLSGTESKVAFTSRPGEVRVAVIGGTVGKTILSAKKQSDRVQTAVAIIRKVAPARFEPGGSRPPMRISPLAALLARLRR